jgi:flagella basal body P-ring formation protein FlgA
MRTLAILVVLATQVANAAPVEDAMREQMLPSLPANTDIAKVYLPANLAKLDVDSADVIVEMPRTLGIGRKSVKVTVRGQRAVFVPVLIGELADVAIAEKSLAVGQIITADDVRIETRGQGGGAKTYAKGTVVVGSKVAKAIKAGALVGEKDITLPPPLPRGTQVAIVMQRGAVRVRGEGTLELVARPGETATVRLAHNKTIVRGTLVAPATVVLGNAP